MTPRAVHTVVQLLAAVAMTAGVFLLFGIPWALLVGGFWIFIGSVAGEAFASRPVAVVEQPRPDGAG